MNKQIFKIGDRVFDIRYGWGKVTKYKNVPSYPIGVQFDKNDLPEMVFYLKDGKVNLYDNEPLLSFTEYGFDDRFSQERPINYDDFIGKWGIFKGSCYSPWKILSDCTIIDTLRDVCEIDDEDEDDCMKGARFLPHTVDKRYKYFEPLTEEQLKILKLK